MKCLWLWLLITSCISEGRQILFTSEVLSLTDSKLPATRLERGSYVTVKYCTADKPRGKKDEDPGEVDRRREWGPLEHLLAKAHEETKSPYFLKTTIYTEDSCLLLRGYTGR